MLNKLSSTTNENKIDFLLANVGDIALRKRSKSIFLNLNPQNREKILEVGCGDGFYLYVISKLTPKAELVGVDLNPSSLESAKKHLRGRNIKLVVADAQDLPFRNASFDKVIMSEVLEHIPKDLVALKEVHRVLKPDGMLLISVPNKNYPFFWDPINWLLERIFDKRLQKGMWGIWAQHLRLYTPKLLLSRLREAGFEVEHIESQIRWALPFNHYLITLGAVMLAKNSVAPSTRKEVNKFELPKRAKTGLIGTFFAMSNLVDRLNDKVELEGPAEGIFVKALKS